MQKTSSEEVVPGGQPAWLKGVESRGVQRDLEAPLVSLTGGSRSVWLARRLQCAVKDLDYPTGSERRPGASSMGSSMDDAFPFS